MNLLFNSEQVRPLTSDNSNSGCSMITMVSVGLFCIAAENFASTSLSSLSLGLLWILLTMKSDRKSKTL